MTSIPGEPATKAEYPERWEERWSTGMTKWDQGGPHKSLVALLDSNQSDELGIPREGKAVIPGCGRGYDLPLFAKRGLEAVGLDISTTGAAAARKYLADQPHGAGMPETKIEVVDFFKYEDPTGFDILYDYTFLCALPPDLRKDWARQMTSLARQAPSSRLITQIFPINGAPGGPPYNLSMEVYHDLLDSHWELIHLEDIPEAHKRHTGPPGDEKLGVWKLRI